MNNKIEQLGKQWCTEIVRDLNERRNSTAASLARLKNHGHYRDAHTVAIGMMDRMLAAALAAPAVANAANSDALPPLPAPAVSTDMHYEGRGHSAFTADQMQDYARAALASLPPQKEAL